MGSRTILRQMNNQVLGYRLIMRQWSNKVLINFRSIILSQHRAQNALYCRNIVRKPFDVLMLS